MPKIESNMQINAVAWNRVRAPEDNLPCVVGAVFCCYGAAGAGGRHLYQVSLVGTELEQKDHAFLPVVDKTEREDSIAYELWRNHVIVNKREQFGLCP